MASTTETTGTSSEMSLSTNPKYVYFTEVSNGCDGDVKIFEKEEDAYKHVFVYDYTYLYSSLTERKNLEKNHENCVCDECKYYYKRKCTSDPENKTMCYSKECQKCTWNRAYDDAIRHLVSIISSNDSWKEKYEKLGDKVPTSDFGNLGYGSFALREYGSDSYSEIKKMELF